MITWLSAAPPRLSLRPPAAQQEEEALPRDALRNGQGHGLAMQDASDRVKEERSGCVLNARTRLHDLLHHHRLSDTALPLALELQVRQLVLQGG